tara:strand:- start:364 stop:516 length:153 start_codon:yes stop_codon:yes gene_type:complete
LNKKNSIPLYIKAIIRENPKVSSGRKNFSGHHKRIIDTIKIIKKYFNVKN